MTPRTISTEPWTDRSRGQLMLVGAIVMALVVISTVVLLNGVQLSEHTGSEDALRAADQTQATTEALQTNVQTVFEHFEDNGGPYISNQPANLDDFREDVVLFNKTYTNLTAFHTSSFVNVDIDASNSVSGRAVRSDGGSFESASASSSWTVVSERSAMPYVSFNVTDQSRNPGTDFTIRFEDSSDSTDYTALRFTEDSVFLDRPSSSVELCASDTDGRWTHLRIVDGGARLETEGSLECDAFSVEFDSNMNVDIAGGSEARGSFLLTVDEPTGTTPLTPAASNYGTAGSGEPYVVGSAAQPVLVNPALEIDYNAPDMTHETSVFVMGGNVDT